MGKVFYALFVLFIGLVMGAGITWRYYYNNSEKLNRLKSDKDHLRAPDIHDSEEQNNTKKIEFERIALEIEEQELYTTNYYGAWIVCLMLSIVLPLGGCCGHAFTEYAKHPAFEDCIESCPFLSCFASLCCAHSQDDVNQIAQALRVETYEREMIRAPLSVVFRRAPSREDSVVHETAADLPGVPSTSNDSEG